MAEKAQHRRHALDRLLQRAGTSTCAGAQHRAHVDQVAQHRRAAPTGCASGGRHRAGSASAARARARAAPGRSAFPGRRARPARRSAPSARAAAPAPVSSQAAVRDRWRSCAARLASIARRSGPVGLAAGDLVEMHDPGEDAASPARRSARRPDASAALSASQLCTSARAASRAAGADADQVGEPGETVPGGEPVRPGAGRKPYRRRVAHQLAGQLDLAGEDRVAALGVARPALADPEPQIGRHAARSACGDRAGRRPARAARRAAAGSADPGPRRRGRCAHRPPGRSGPEPISSARRPRCGGRRTGRSADGRGRTCPAVESMPLRNKEKLARRKPRRRAESSRESARRQALACLTSRAP